MYDAYSADREKIFSASSELVEFFTEHFDALECQTDEQSIKESLSLAKVTKTFSSIKQSLS